MAGNEIQLKETEVESNKTRNFLIGGVVTLAIVVGGGAFAIASSDKSDDKEVPLTNTEITKAEKAAAGEVKGRVVYVESEDDHGGGYEAEVLRKDGTTVEVYLNKSFEVVGVEPEYPEGKAGQDWDDEDSSDYSSDYSEPGQGPGSMTPGGKAGQ